MRLVRFSILVPLVSITLLALPARNARAECNCVAVAAEVAASVQAEVLRADNLFARGDFAGALALYAKAHATSKDAALLYAQAMAHWQLGARAEAQAMFNAYLATGGALAYKARAEAGLAELAAGVTPTAVPAVATGTKLTGGLTGEVRGRGEGVVGAGVATGAGVTGELRGQLGQPQPQKVGKKAGIVLGVIAIAAIGAVGIHAIAAGISDNIELDPKFDLGLGIGGVAVGITAIYVSGLTATAGVAGGVPCASLPAKQPIVAPIALPGGGGLAAAMTF
jgi:hypothetical protein